MICVTKEELSAKVGAANWIPDYTTVYNIMLGRE